MLGADAQRLYRKPDVGVTFIILVLEDGEGRQEDPGVPQSARPARIGGSRFSEKQYLITTR